MQTKLFLNLTWVWLKLSIQLKKQAQQHMYKVKLILRLTWVRLNTQRKHTQEHMYKVKLVLLFFWNLTWVWLNFSTQIKTNKPKVIFEFALDFGFDFGANMPPCPHRKSIKIASKLELRRHRFFDRFLH